MTPSHLGPSPYFFWPIPKLLSFSPICERLASDVSIRRRPSLRPPGDKRRTTKGRTTMMERTEEEKGERGEGRSWTTKKMPIAHS